MARYYIPYVGENPAAIDVKGHRLIVVSTSAQDLTDELSLLGGTSVRELNLDDEEMEYFNSLAASIRGGVVLSPPGVSVSAMIRSLEAEIPWVQ